MNRTPTPAAAPRHPAGRRRTVAAISALAAAVASGILSLTPTASAAGREGVCTQPPHCTGELPPETIMWDAADQELRDATLACLASKDDYCMGRSWRIKSVLLYQADIRQTTDPVAGFVSHEFFGCTDTDLTKWLQVNTVPGHGWHLSKVGFLPQLGVSIGPVTIGALGDFEWEKPLPNEEVSYQAFKATVAYGHKATATVTPALVKISGSALVRIRSLEGDGDGPLDFTILVPGQEHLYPVKQVGGHLGEYVGTNNDLGVMSLQEWQRECEATAT